MKKVYKMEDLECAHCASIMEQKIVKLCGVQAVNISFLAQKMTITFDEGADIDAVMKEAAAICRKVEKDCRIIL